MGLVHLNGPPDCPDPRGWCFACLMRAKQAQWETSEDERAAGYARDDNKIIYIPWPDALTRELRPGAYRAVCGDLPMLGVVDGLCWDDVAGTNPTNVPSGLLEAKGPLPPGLARKMKG